MWTLRIHIPGYRLQEYSLLPGKNIIGRDKGNSIILDRPSISRQHAQIDYDSNNDTATLLDLSSTNGTFVNNQQINSRYTIQHRDTIHIGSVTIKVHHHTTKDSSTTAELSEGTHPITRELLLGALDLHTVLLYEVAERLNTITDLNKALTEVSSLLKKHMGADRCKIILKEQFDKLHELGFPKTIAQTAIDQKSTVIKYRDTETTSASAMLLRVRSALCTPVISNDEVIALIYMYKTNPESNSFTQSELEITIAISHQAALTIQRVILFSKLQKEQKLRQMFQRFISPQEVNYFLDEYQKDHETPKLKERYVSILFADIENSTALAEKLGAKGFGEILRQYYTTATEIVFKNRGIVKYLGDGILAVFGMTENTSQHEQEAVQTGLAILEAMSKLTNSFKHSVHTGIGVKTGPAVVGYVGPPQRLEFTVLGDAVNVAYSLQLHARPNRLLVGEITHQKIKEKYVTAKLPSIQVKGRNNLVEAYEIKNHTPQYSHA